MEDGKELFASLRASVDARNYDDAIHLCGQALALDGDDEDALRTKCVCLIHLSKYQAAFDSVSLPQHRDKFVPERAYCLFKLEKFQQALDLCRNTAEPSDALLHIEAQAVYRLGHFKQAAEAYDRLQEAEEAARSGDDATLTNVFAAYCAAGWGKAALAEQPPGQLAPDAAYELLYNVGCALLQAGDVRRAADVLGTAEEHCVETLRSGGASQEEIDEETAPLRAQRAYACHVLGMSDDAARLCKEVLRCRSAEPAVAAVATNNLTAIRQDREPAETIKKLKAALTPAAEKKLTARQLEAMRLNSCIILLRMGKVQDAREALAELRQTRFLSAGFAALEASLLLTEKKASEAEAALQEAAKMTVAPEDATTLRLMLVQANAAQGNPRQAADLLLAEAALNSRPAAIATAAALVGRANGSAQALDHLAAALPSLTPEASSRAVESVLSPEGAKRPNAVTGVAGHPFPAFVSPAFYSGTPVERLAAARLAIGARLLSARRYKEAAEAFEGVLEMGAELESGTTLVARASLIVACSWYDGERAQELSLELPARLSSADEDLDPLALESSELPRSGRARRLVAVDKAVQKAERKERGADAAKKLRKRARQREKHLAKLAAAGKIDLSKPLPKPDPERWLPLKQRSYANRGRKRNKDLGAQGAGGGGAKDAARLDVAAKVAARKEAALEEKGAGSPLLPPPPAAARGKKKGGRR